MQNSSAFCRTQEALQIQRATDSKLANVRSIATAAAAVWSAEAVLAEQRERRKRVAESLRATTSGEDTFSENPDRGFAEAS